jgi:ABC-type transport system involved in multi-copper enzyme maturation permease subunit
MLEFLAGLMVALLPASWWVLIARVIHEERLIGDTQFWITRPYEWKKLLAAKLLFLAAFIYLPFLIAESLLLAEAGFNPLVYLPGLLLKSLLFVSFFVLSLSALAAVTSNFARMTLTMLGALVGITVFFVLLFLLFGTRANEIHNVFGSQLCLALFVLVCAAAIVLQYALRKAWLARLVLIALPILIAAVTAVSPDQLLMDHRYPVSAVQAADAQIDALLQLAYSPETPHHGHSIQNMGAKVWIGVIIPLAESGVAEGSMINLNALRAEFTAPDGTHWNSAWQNAGEVSLLAGENHPNASIMMPIEFYRKFQSMPLSVHLTFAITQARAGQPITIPLSAGDFTVADFGICSPKTAVTSWGSSASPPCASRR